MKLFDFCFFSLGAPYRAKASEKERDMEGEEISLSGIEFLAS
jgi:hypothetical protein